MPRPPTPGLRERLLAVAGELFYERGVRAVGMAEVVEKAGCGKNAAYRLFPRKADLVGAHLADFAARRDAQIATALKDLDDAPATALEAYVAEAVGQTHHPRFVGCAVRNYVREARADDDAPVRAARSWLTESRELVRSLAARLDIDDPDTLADQIWLVIEGVYAGGPEVADAAPALTRRLLDGAGSRGWR
ncbi:TetR/AcrR family transcriptional regulator [Streptomyces mirabilis]|uniref:TetR/AcrR family transcriptional regulator n=1 Tax=Streptomyces mirabilis TaxID=68239 RepID=UPI0036CE3DAA